MGHGPQLTGQPRGKSKHMTTKTKLLAFGIFLAARAWRGPTALAQSTYDPCTFTTLAGSDVGYGSVDGTGSGARFNGPTGVPVDSAGNVYVADTYNHTIRKGYPAPRILNSGPGFGFNGGQFGFNLMGPESRSVVVEASTDLVSWLPLWTNTFTFPAALSFREPQSRFHSNRFYRAHLP